MQYDISLICVYNNITQYNRMVSSLCHLPFSVEVIGLDNRKGEWSSAASAYNAGIKIAHAPILLFSHQDIVFMGDEFICQLIRHLETYPNTIAGVAGAVETDGGRDRTMLSGMYQGSKLWRHHTASGICPVETLDECLFGCRASLFTKLSFDESVCDGWHFYAVDLCLQARLQNIAVVVIPADVIHESGGNRDSSYYLAQEKIKVKYADRFQVIPTTCGWTRTTEIDPFRPIVDDELCALRSAGIPYEIHFYLPLTDVFNLTNNRFFPSLQSIRGASKLYYHDADEGFFIDLLHDCSFDEAINCLISINNFVAAKSWLYTDLVDLKRDLASATIDELEKGKYYQLGKKLFAWDDTPNILRELFSSSRPNDIPFSPNISKRDKGSVSLRTVDQKLGAALDADNHELLDCISDLSRQWRSFLVANPSPQAMRLLALFSSLCEGPHARLGVDRLQELKNENDLLESNAGYVRYRFKRSLPFIFGKAMYCVLKLINRVRG